MKRQFMNFIFQPFKNRLLKMFLNTGYNVKKFEISTDKKCLCLAPHPDDETIGMGGTIIKYSKQFDVISLTNGCYGIQGSSKDKTTKIRRKEFESAMDFANVNNYEICNIDDKSLIDGFYEFSKINLFNYDYIFIPNYIDQHRDHKAVSVHLYNLIVANKNCVKDNVKIILYEVWSPLTFANKCIDISNIIESKKNLLKFYSSQINEKPYDNAVVGLSRYRGLLKQQDYAEAFYLMDVKEFVETMEYLYEDLLKKADLKKCSFFSKFNFQTPIINDNTFLLWEPCTKSHSEILPGYAKYLLDLGYSVSVLTTPKNIEDKLFSRMQSPNLFINNLTQKQIRKYFKNNNLSNVKGLLMTTTEKHCDQVHYDDIYKHFGKNIDKSKIFLVEHDIKYSVDAGTWNENIITLRKMNYKNANSVVVNPHYFGYVNITNKNLDLTNFIVIGSLKSRRTNYNIFIKAVEKLHKVGINNFKITIIGEGKLKDLPKEIQQYFDIKGRLNFEEMYKELEKSDFMLTAYDPTNINHLRYNTTGTSGAFQLAYGFLKPCLIIESFASINNYNDKNSILYKTSDEYADAMKQAIMMNQADYKVMQNNLKQTADLLYAESKDNLKNLIDRIGKTNE